MASATITAPSELTPHYSEQILQSNFIDFTDSNFEQWGQEHLPHVMAEEVERYGNRTLSGFLQMVSAEYPLESDQVIWTEQGRLHLHYTNVTVAADSNGANVLTVDHNVRVGQTIVITDGTDVLRAYVTAVASDNTTLTVKCYTNATGLVDAGLPTTSEACEFFVYGSEFNKGTAGMVGSLTPEPNVFDNKPIILKDVFAISGSDAAQVGWIEVSGEDGQTGYMWYLKAQGDTRTRFNDYLEMSQLEAVKATHSGVGVDGTEGYFSAVENRGIVAEDVFDASADTIADFDDLLQTLDGQGAIEENMLYLNRAASLNLDDALAAQNSYGAGGTSFGLFQNSEDMALNLGFSGFRRGSYDFYKSDWKYLNDATTRGAIDDIKGTLVPAGTMSVYDQSMGKNVRRPFLHVRYRAKGAINRRLQTRVLGFEAGTSDIDEISLEMLSERCLVTQGANNFVIFK